MIQDPRDSEPAPMLHLYRVRLIFLDLTECDPVFVMARHDEEAAMLVHKARARDTHDACEVIVSMVQNGEECDG